MMRRPNAEQMKAVIRIAGVMWGDQCSSLHECLAALMSPNVEAEARFSALNKLRSLSGLIARYCDDYSHAEHCESECRGRE